MFGESFRARFFLSFNSGIMNFFGMLLFIVFLTLLNFELMLKLMQKLKNFCIFYVFLVSPKKIGKASISPKKAIWKNFFAIFSSNIWVLSRHRNFNTLKRFQINHTKIVLYATSAENGQFLTSSRKEVTGGLLFFPLVNQNCAVIVVFILRE